MLKVIFLLRRHPKTERVDDKGSWLHGVQASWVPGRFIPASPCRYVNVHSMDNALSRVTSEARSQEAEWERATDAEFLKSLNFKAFNSFSCCHYFNRLLFLMHSVIIIVTRTWRNFNVPVKNVKFIRHSLKAWLILLFCSLFSPLLWFYFCIFGCACMANLSIWTNFSPLVLKYFNEFYRGL